MFHDTPVVRFRLTIWLNQTGRNDYRTAEYEAQTYGQCTRTNDYDDAPWVCQCLRRSVYLHVSRHVHYRIVLRHAGYPLRTFSGSRELFGAAHDALRGSALNHVHSINLQYLLMISTGIESAYTRCKRLHRDISLDNIILYRVEASQPRRGMLVDWEFSALIDGHGKAVDGTQIVRVISLSLISN